MAPANSISIRQGQILCCIARSLEDRGFPPSVREIGEKVGLSSSSTVQCHLRTLEKRDCIWRDPTKPRALTITSTGREIVSELLGRPINGLLLAVSPIEPSEIPDEALAQTRLAIEGVLSSPAVMDRAALRIRETHTWLNQEGARAVAETAFAAVKECL